MSWAAAAKISVSAAVFVKLSTAWADVRPTHVSLTVDACLETQADSLVRILALEMGATIKRVGNSPLGSPPAGTNALVHVTCLAQPGLIDVSAQASGIEGHRVVSLASVDPRVHARVVALAVAELFETPPAAPAPAVTRSPALPSSLPTLHNAVSVQMGSRRFLVGADNSFNVGVLYWHPNSSHVAVWGKGDAERGEAQRALGSVQTQSFAAGAGAAWYTQPAQLGMAFGLGCDVGYIAARGEPTDTTATSSSVAGLWFGLLAKADVFYDVGRFRLGAFAEAGHTLVTIKALTNTRDERLWRGPWLRVGLSTGWRW